MPSVALLQENRETFDELLKFDSSPQITSQTNVINSTKPLQLRKISSNRQLTLKLNDGHKIPLLGLGTWNAQGRELKEAVKSAIYAGYRHIDTASNYKNEVIVGEAIAECIKENVVSRKDLYITTKLWNNSHMRGSVPRALQASLKALKLNYVDLYLIHYPIGYKEGAELSPVDERGVLQTSDVDYVETWLGMQDVKHLGLTRSIGVSNFNKHQIKRILYYCTTVPAINQVECHPYLNQTKLINFCKKHQIGMTAYSPLGSPGRQGAAAKDQKKILIQDPVILSIAKKNHVTAGQVLISYQLQRKIVVIPKAIQKAHLDANLDSLNIKLTDAEMQQLNALDCNHRFMIFERCLNHKYYPFDEELEDENKC